MQWVLLAGKFPKAVSTILNARDCRKKKRKGGFVKERPLYNNPSSKEASIVLSTDLEQHSHVDFLRLFSEAFGVVSYILGIPA